MPKSLAVVFAAAWALASAHARQMTVTPSASQFADTEAVTNIALHSGRNDTVSLDLRIRLDGTPSNDLEVAFGRDSNTNGVLDAEEIETIYGWRGGRHFIEDSVGWERIEAEADTNAVACGAMDIHVENDPQVFPKAFTATCGGEPAFAELSASTTPWLYRREWDTMRVVRRGAGSPTGWIDCRVGYGFMGLWVR